MGAGERQTWMTAVSPAVPSATLRCRLPGSMLLALLLSALLLLSHSPAAAHSPSPSPKTASTVPRLVRTHRHARLPVDYPSTFSSLSSSLSSLSPSSSLSSSQSSWVSHQDLANLTHLPLLHSIAVPLPINVIALGLDGTGHQSVNLTGDGLSTWLEHLDHLHPQFYTNEDPTTSPPLALPTHLRPSSLPHAAHITYAYQFHLLTLAPSVLRLVEQTLAASYRLTSPANPTPPDPSAPPEAPADYQVDPAVITGLFDSLLTHLGTHLTPTLILINPQRRWVDPPGSPPLPPRRYGYRTGLSNEEIDQVVEPQGDMRAVVDSLRQHPDVRWRDPDTRTSGIASVDEAKRRERRPRIENYTVTPVDVVDFTAESDRWARGQLTAPVGTPPYPLSLQAHLTRLAKDAPTSLISYLNDGYVQEDCLMEVYPSTRLPLVLLDLSAGPFAWGPTVGGEGVKTERSFPSIAVFANANPDDANVDEWRQEEVDADSVKAEKILVEGRLFQAECDSPHQRDDEHCTSLRDTWRALSAMEREFKRRKLRQTGQETKPINASLLHRNALSYFRSDDDDVIGQKAGQLRHDEHIESNHFLSHLSSTLSMALHHWVTPSLAHPAVTQRYASAVTFHLYVLVDHERYDPLHGQLLERLKHGVEQVRMEGQTFDFIVHRMRVSDEPALAMAYANAFRSAVIPTLMHDGHFSAIKRLYLDTSVLLHQLLRLKPDSPPPAAPSTVYATRTISIFLFSMDYPLPVFLDKSYVSRAFPQHEVVISTQSSYHLYESPVSCNHAPLYVNLNYPYHDLLASIVRLLTATLPHHLAHSSQHSATSQWAMSLGGSVLTPLASGHQFSPLEVQAMHRSYVVLHLTEFTHAINMAVLRMQDTPLTGSSAGLQSMPRWRRLVATVEKEYGKLMEYIELLALLMEGGKVELAVDQLMSMSALVKQFEGRVRTLIGQVEEKECEDVSQMEGMLGGEVVERKRIGLGRWRWTCYLLCILACLLIAAFRAVQWQLKPKSS